MQFFTYLWTGEEFDGRKKNHPDWLLDFAAGNQFVERGVEEVDYVYVWYFIRGQLYLLGRMRVAGIYTQAEVKRLYSKIAEKYSFWAAEHIVAAPESIGETHFDLVVPTDVISKLRFAGNMAAKQKDTPLQNDFEPQTFRGVRRLMPTSASLLDELLKEHRA